MNDISEIKRSLLKIYPFSEIELNQFTDKLIYKKINKKEYLIRKNQTSNYLTFVLRGSFRFYSETEAGELTLSFITENLWFADIESLLLQKPSNNFIIAFEDSDVAIISMKDIHELMDSHPNFRMLYSLLANLTIPASHIATISVKSPDERYRELLLNHPDWLNRFPQMQIASFLGMTPETLSRVRARTI